MIATELRVGSRLLVVTSTKETAWWHSETLTEGSGERTCTGISALTRYITYAFATSQHLKSMMEPDLLSPLGETHFLFALTNPRERAF